jgi:hypothetical protein
MKFGIGGSKFGDPLEVALKSDSNNEHVKTYTRVFAQLSRFAHLQLNALRVYN